MIKKLVCLLLVLATLAMPALALKGQVANPEELPYIPSEGGPSSWAVSEIEKAAAAGIVLHLVPTGGHLYTTYQNVFARGRAIIGIYGSQGEPELEGARQIPFEDPDLNWDIYFSSRQNYRSTASEEAFFRYILSFAGEKSH